MKTTANLQLKKPEASDFYNVDDFNENADKLDEAIAAKADKSYVETKFLNMVPVIDVSAIALNQLIQSGKARCDVVYAVSDGEGWNGGGSSGTGSGTVQSVQLADEADLEDILKGE